MLDDLQETTKGFHIETMEGSVEELSFSASLNEKFGVKQVLDTEATKNKKD